MIKLCMKIFWKKRRNMNEKRVEKIRVSEGDRRSMVGELVSFKGLVKFGLIKIKLSILKWIW